MTSEHRALRLVVPLLVLHNVEEALTMRRFLAAHAQQDLPSFVERPDAAQFAWALALVTALALLLPPLARRLGGAPARQGVLLGMQAVMLLNVLSHVGLAAWVRGYAPGLVTALALTLPFSLYLFHRAFWERWVARRLLAALVPVALLVHGPLLFALMWLAGRLTHR
jgi:hypothetical protein